MTPGQEVRWTHCTELWRSQRTINKMVAN